MARKAINKATYDKLLEAYRRDGQESNVTGAARYAGVSWETAKRALEQGWPKKGYPSVLSVREQEKKAARATLQAEIAAKNAHAEKEREDAFKQAVEARKQEGQMVQLTRAQSMQALTVTVQLARSARELAPIIAKFIDTQGKKLEQWNNYELATLNGQQATPPTLARPAISAHQGLEMLQKVAALSAQIVGTARQAMEMERLHLGKPTDIIGLTPHHSGEMTMEEALARLEAAQNAMEAWKDTDGFYDELPGQDVPTIGEVVEDV